MAASLPRGWASGLASQLASRLLPAPFWRDRRRSMTPSTGRGGGEKSRVGRTWPSLRRQGGDGNGPRSEGVPPNATAPSLDRVATSPGPGAMGAPGARGRSTEPVERTSWASSGAGPRGGAIADVLSAVRTTAEGRSDGEDVLPGTDSDGPDRVMCGSRRWRKANPLSGSQTFEWATGGSRPAVGVTDLWPWCGHPTASRRTPGATDGFCLDRPVLDDRD